jgi:NAD(P)-dependent dehydrogenase (short-subunit alcohol dehydrogenase family)
LSRVILIVGASRGLGAAYAQHALSEGARVHLAGRELQRLERWRSSPVAGLHAVDARDAAAAAGLVRAVVEREQGLDALVVTLGDFHAGATADLDSAVLGELFASNVQAPLNLFQAARPALRARQGAALFFGTVGLEAQRARQRTAGYSAAKSALWTLVRSWALEEARYGVRVNLLSPGLVPHPESEGSEPTPERLAAIPLGRVGRVEEIARAAAWLVSDQARYVTGVNLELAGGWLA